MADWRSVLVLLASIGLFVLAASIFRVSLRGGWRLAILEAYAALGFLVWLITESLGAFRAITFTGLALAWGLAGAVGAIIAVRLRAPIRAAVATEYSRLRRGLRSMPAEASLALTYMAAIVLILGVIAFAAAPNTWDSLTYHLSRVMHWQQDRSLSFYPTATQRQLSFGPLAEMVILNYQVLAGSDRLANFVQLFAMMGCVVGVTLIADRLGAGQDAQVFAALATLVIPIGILEATSTQNDYVVALWCVCFVAFALERFQEANFGPPVSFTGAALGLAILTKATAVLYLAPIALWLALELARRLGLGAWRPLVIVLGAAIAIMAPHSIRNYLLYGNPLGITPGPELGQLTNGSHRPAVVASNLIRNAGMELGSPFEGLNKAIEAVILQAHRGLGIDINDPRTTWEASDYQVEFHVVFSTHEDSANNPLQLVVVAGAALGLIGYRSSRARIYMLCLAGGAIAFCFLLKWQPWNNRLHLPFLVLAMPVVAAVAAKFLRGRSIYLPAFVMAIVALPYLFANPSRPLLGSDSVLLKDRLTQYFTNVPDHFQDYDQATRLISGAKCDQVGLVSPFDGREYLVWVTTRAYSASTRVEHILVRNLSRRLKINFTPCAIVVLSPLQTGELIYEDRTYIRTVDREGFNVYLIAGASP